MISSCGRECNSVECEFGVGRCSILFTRCTSIVNQSGYDMVLAIVQVGMLGKKPRDFLTVINTFYQEFNVITTYYQLTMFYQLIMFLPALKFFTSYYLLNQFSTIFIIGPQSRLSLCRVARPVEKTSNVMKNRAGGVLLITM